MKLSVDVRNDVYNWFRVLDSIPSFGNLNDQFRTCFWPKVKNLTSTIPSVNPIGHFWLRTLFPTIFMQKIREVTHVSKILVNFNNCHFEVIHFNLFPIENFNPKNVLCIFNLKMFFVFSFLPFMRKFTYFPLGFLNT